MSEVSRLMDAIEQGDPQAAEQLLPLVYRELRQLAAKHLASEKPGQTLDATGLVHEAYLRLVGDRQFANRRHFFGAAAEAMRRILVDRARARGSQKRGGARRRAPIDDADLAAPEQSETLLDLDDALKRLAAEHPEIERVVVLRYFAGLSIPQVAETLGISPRTANRHWTFARTWLFQQLQNLD